ncbi:hypothetical protein EMIHUDRAFT_253699 [Emiliania huxleyi CCMP1516]|uniref:Uncharacterized protein n=2 Tax=Emiliania huxleyi TaxID=2903 RepID=A0A0D3K438_EMIH1|nr:hypothetical protein EMIHUDRAFT_253699 [Emiliania huxleyi CCMP1516]EOD30523.1 hypothetical protein EMIHUDRAFT_253699 [Emiliania huxleyi CCMP1516]|eukprot:XP_005782952.1 hypothetical protein EMIHUDRAFT_253699 [Emiliania huxleyi CCMP1516]
MVYLCQCVQVPCPVVWRRHPSVGILEGVVLPSFSGCFWTLELILICGGRPLPTVHMGYGQRPPPGMPPGYGLTSNGCYHGPPARLPVPTPQRLR